MLHVCNFGFIIYPLYIDNITVCWIWMVYLLDAVGVQYTLPEFVRLCRGAVQVYDRGQDL